MVKGTLDSSIYISLHCTAILTAAMSTNFSDVSDNHYRILYKPCVLCIPFHLEVNLNSALQWP